MKTILFITNGHGEDLVAVELIKLLKEKHNCLAFPLVGKGEAFDQLGVTVLGQRKRLPSGGFSLRNYRFLLKDLPAGLLGATLKNIHQLESLKGKIDLVVAIGDLVPLIGALFTQTRYIFIGVNKSAYYHTFGFNYTPWEVRLLRKTSQLVFCRDLPTNYFLHQHKVLSEYVGNPLMDCIGKTNPEPAALAGQAKSRGSSDSFCIGLLPGTRDDVKKNLADMEKVVEALIAFKEPDTKFRFITATTLPVIPEYLERKSFPELLSEADIVLGLSGTANEQAAGCGLPVVSFYGHGSQYNKKFAEAQKQLLGKSLYLVRSHAPDLVAAELWRLLNDPNKLKRIGDFGRERMGPPGAVQRIATYLESL